MSEHRLPFDTVFLLNRYFEIVGRAVEDFPAAISTSSSVTVRLRCSD